jgi:cyclophilin family peptidyl-prolyl cis-trans isomerase
MKKLFWTLLLGIWGVSDLLAQVTSVYADSSKTALILVETKFGPIKIRLFNQTPLHRDNCLKLVAEGFYDSLLFHRVIQGFMIQGGDPDSKTAKPGQLLGDGEIKGADWIPAEFNKDLFHKRGVLAAARENDDKNPEKKSSSCQFYITQGRGPLSDKDLKLYEYRINKKLRMSIKDSLLNLPENAAFAQKYERFRKEKLNDSLMAMDKSLDDHIEPVYQNRPHYTFSEEQVRVYKAIGGTPHLDGNYTVYGEVISGMDVVDKIAAVGTDKNDRPDIDIRMKVSILRHNK